MVKSLSLLTVFLWLFSFSGFSQDVEGVNANPRYHKSISQQNADKNQCYNQADAQFKDKNNRTLKRTGIGAGIGVVAGKILGKPGTGAVIGGGAGAYTGYRKNNKEEKVFNESYASCLRDRGYDAEINN